MRTARTPSPAPLRDATAQPAFPSPPRSRVLTVTLATSAGLLLPAILPAQSLARPTLVLAVLLACASWAYLPAAMLVASRASAALLGLALLLFAGGWVAREATGLLPWLAGGHAATGLLLVQQRRPRPREATAWWAWAAFFAALAARA